MECRQWCRDLGIKEVTAYAFSIENFKRSEEEVSQLMDLFGEKLRELLKEQDKLKKNGVRIRIIGNASLFTLHVQKLIADVELCTKDGIEGTINLAMAYSAREEITHAVQTVAAGVKEGLISIDDIDQELLQHCLYTRKSRPVDLLLRTSGETRLSDFMLWQSQYSCLYFCDILWPEFTFWKLFAGMFTYQRHLRSIQRAPSTWKISNEKQQMFLDYIDEQKESSMKKMLSENNNILI